MWFNLLEVVEEVRKIDCDHEILKGSVICNS